MTGPKAVSISYLRAIKAAGVRVLDDLVTKQDKRAFSDSALKVAASDD
jgi:hypothetical protein